MTHATDKTINALAVIAYSYAVELHEASIRADCDELEHIARQITERLKANLHAALEGHQAATPGAETLVRYCPGCGIVGPVEGEYLDCCPDGNEARTIPEALARKCHDTFRLAVDGAFATQTAPTAHGDIVNEAIRCAAWLEHVAAGGDVVEIDGLAGTSAAELRRLSAMVDELRELLQNAKRAMTELHQAAIPDESTEGVPAIIPPEAFAKFVDAHAQLCFLMHQRGHNSAKEGQRNG